MADLHNQTRITVQVLSLILASDSPVDSRDDGTGSVVVCLLFYSSAAPCSISANPKHILVANVITANIRVM